jgi:peroxiredoxin
LKKLLLLPLFALFLCACGESSLPEKSANATDFSLPSFDGKTAQLSSYKGSYVLLDFWREGCPGCDYLNPLLEKLYRDNSSKNFVVIGINISDSADEVSRYMKFNGLTFPSLLDSEGKVSDNYDLRGTPYLVLIDKEGRLIDSWLGFSGVIWNDLKNKIEKLS